MVGKIRQRLAGVALKVTQYASVEIIKHENYIILYLREYPSRIFFTSCA